MDRSAGREVPADLRRAGGSSPVGPVAAEAQGRRLVSARYNRVHSHFAVAESVAETAISRKMSGSSHWENSAGCENGVIRIERGSSFRKNAGKTGAFQSAKWECTLTTTLDGPITFAGS
jgi:hypothetical protein